MGGPSQHFGPEMRNFLVFARSVDARGRPSAVARGNGFVSNLCVHMTLRIRHFGAALVFALSLSTTAHAQDEPKTPLGKKMAAMNTALKAVGRQIDDPSKNANTLEQIAIIETNAKASLTMEPEKKGKIPAADQAKFVSDYQAEMKKLLVVVDKMKAAVKAGNNAEASKILDDVKGAQREGHKEFRLKKAGAPPV